MNDNPIAVVGIGCHYPGAKDIKELWENILSRRRQFRKMPDQRLPLADYHDPNPDTPDKTYTRYAALIDGFEFDWAGRRIPKTTYESSDIVHWLALEVATQALSDAGYSRENLPKTKTGVLLGNTLTGEFTRSQIMRLRWPYVRKTLRAAGKSQGLSNELIDQLEKHMENIYKSAFPPVTEDSLAGWLSNTIAGRICNYYDLHGGGYVVDGACSSSLLAVATAAGKLANGELDLALAGGIDISLDPMEIVGFAKAGALTSKDMNVYDRNSSGFIPGEGCGFVVLKRLEDARRDGDYVYAVIRGWGISSDGKGGVTAPKAEGQALALRRAYEMAGYSPHELDFIEGHGTGTVVGDRTELEGIALARDAFGKTESRSCGVTSFKSLVGHTKAAAGIGGLIKAVLSVNQRVLVPTAACKEPNDVFYTAAQSIYPILQGEVREPDQQMRAGVSAMGFGGINCHVTLESADLPKQELKPEIEERALLVSNQDTELFVLAADSKEDLLAQVKQVRKMAEGMSIAELVDLACHLTKNVKAGARFRAALIADHPDRLHERLEFMEQKLANDFPAEGEVYADLEKQVWISNQVNQHRVGFLFPGQGSQKVNMARTLFERFPWARELAEQVWEVLPQGKERMFRPLDKARNQEEIKEWEKQLSQTEVAQPTICLASVLWAKFLERLGIKPDVVAGHSLGELSALYAAGAYDEKTLFQLAAIRGKAMSASEEEAGTMASLRCNQEEVEKILKEVSGYVVVANLNSSMQTVISGEKEAVAEAVKIAQDRQIQAVMLPVSNAFHSELVHQAANTLREHAPVPVESVKLSVPFISGMDGKELKSLSNGKEYFANQVISQVDFISLISTMKEKCDLLVEVGPGRVLTGLVNDQFQGTIACFPVESRPGMDYDLHQFLAVYFVQGGQVHWEALYENRLVRPFVPASEKNFIVNPCENPLSVPSPGDAGEIDVSFNLPEAKDLPADVINQYLKERGSFILDVIRADLKHMNVMSSVPQLKQTVEQKPVARQVSQPALQSVHHVEQAVIQLAAERTGYPMDSIRLDHRLLDDLNLDSIKSAELVSSLAHMFGVADQIDPSGFANATLEEVVREVQALLPDQLSEAVEERKSHDVADLLIRQAEQITGYPRESIHMDLRLLDDLNLDSIKSAELVANVAKELGVADRVDPSLFANATLKEVSQALESLVPQKSEDAGENSIADSLLKWVTKLTGYPRESISMDLRLLDDLNLDSIKSAELVSQVAKEFHLEGKLDPTLFANATLKDIERELEQLIEHKPEKPKVIVSKQPQSSKRTWVRNFVVDYVEKPLTIKDIAFPETSRFLIVAKQKRHALAQALSQELNHYQIPQEIVTFGELQDQDLLKNEAFSHIVVILPKTDTNEDIAEIVKRLQSVVQPVKDYGYKASITYIQYGGGYFGTRLDQIELATCTANAFAASLHLERPNAKIRVIDLSPALKPQAIVKNVLLEISAEDAFISVGYDEHNVRRVPQAIVQRPKSYPSRLIEWTKEDVILVTGGAKGITAECALGVAKSTGAKMALVGSSALEKSREVQKTLERYRQEGLVCQYYQCDITDRSAVEQLIKTVQEELGQVTGVIHGAGLVHSRRAEQITLEAFLREIGPKVFGALNLCDVLKDQPPKLFIGFSSLTGLSGMAGNTSYGFANEVLQLILRRFEKEHLETQVLAVAFGVWDEVGMGARSGSINFLEKKGVYAIPVSEGVERFVHLFHHDPQAKQVVVTAKIDGLDTWHPRPVKREKEFRFIEEIVTDYPEVELVTRVHLDLERDSYVKDHVFNGTYLFPTVFGLEAMAQAVSYVTGIEDFSRVRIEDIQLKLPIVLDPKKGVTVEVRAEVLEDRRVVTEIRTEQTGFAKAHFAATFVFPSEVEVKKQDVSFPEEPLAIEPKEDLYGPLMFQGPLYQRIEKVYDVKYNQEQKTGSCQFTARAESMEEFLLGDPYHHDALLQSVQMVVPQDVCLPVQIASFEKLGLYENMKGTWKSVARLEEKGDSYYIYTVDVLDEKNQVVQTLAGYKVHIMEHKPERPTVEELVTIAFPDERRLAQAIQASADSFQIEVPVMTIAHLPGIHKQKKDQRRARVIPLFKRALVKAGANEVYSVTWNETGKPVVLKQGTVTSDYHVSFSHDDEVTICVLGKAEQGCDILPIESHRDEEEWSRLLTTKYQSLIQTLKESGDSVAQAGSRIWAGIEAVKKASGANVQGIDIGEVLDEAVLLKVKTEQSNHTVLTIPVQLSKPTKRMVAIVVSSEMSQSESNAVLLNDEFHPDYGFVHRFALTHPISFTLGRRTEISSYATWVGKVRELALSSVRERVRKQFATGRYGMVTNFVQTEVFGEAGSHDVMEVHVQVDRIENDSYIEMVYYWHKVKKDKDLELIAVSRQGLTWVEIVGHDSERTVRPSPFPDYFRQYLDDNLTIMRHRHSLERKATVLSDQLLGKELFEVKTGPANRMILQKTTIETTLEESDLVGNIFFSNYSIWQSKVRDQFFYKLAPELYHGVGEQGEWLALYSQVKHLREAVPFDTIQVEMSLSKRYEYGAKLFFEYYKLGPDGNRQKLAYGEQDIIWVKRDEYGNPYPAPLPEVFEKELEKVPQLR
ncbi:type I polyketide synthase [Thermoflavimicrobium dichotomicum]|uniref:Acyl transferase domain-containing protein n=1 Tax=Thermoflavimicrobium dichotomicum TaxID=46223 RepID=A0A1I3UAD2_9BACL|nr:type I polyketide synthase [Thermoflavimicrobium dichotomicum]SFJ80464.1 Acyl transferase domain-containing protein [Thermoflavimicrobium dichotomicum]